MKKSVALVLLCSLLSVHALNAPSISFLGETLPDHGYVDLSLVGDAVSGGDSVQCRTDLSSCCGNIDSGDWFAPNGSRIPFSDSDSDIYKVPGEKRIDLRQRNSNEISGIYRCDIETMATVNISDSNSRAVTRESIYVGLYANGGNLKISGGMTVSLVRRRDSFRTIFTCVSTGGPATHVTWIRNTALANGRKKTVLDDPVTAQYTHTLAVDGRLDGRYLCIVANDKPSRADASFSIEDDLLRVSAISKSSTTATIAWSLAAGVTAKSYIISYSNTDTECFTDSDDITGIGGSETTYTLSGLQEGTEYSITVTATLSNGATFEKSISLSTTSTALSAAPSPLNVMKVTSNAITVQWGAVDCIHHNGDIIGYTVQYGEVGSESMQTVNVTGNGTTISGLTSSTAYVIEVAVVNSVGVGPYSTSIVETNGIDLSVDIPSISTTSISLSLTLNEDQLPATSYTVSYSNTNNTECFTDFDEVTGITATMYTLTGLKEGTEYSITVTASLSNGESVRESTVGTTKATVPSASPNLVGVAKVTSTAITVQWGEVDCVHRNGDITGYTVQYGEVESESIQTVHVASDVTQTTISGLITNALYHIQVAAVNSAGEGEYSRSIEVSPYVQQSVGSAESSSTDTMSFTEATVMSGSVGFVVGVIVTLLVVTLLVSVIVCRRKAKINSSAFKDVELHVESKGDVELTDNAAYTVASTARNSYQEEVIYEHVK